MTDTAEILDPEEAAHFLRLSPRTLEYYRQKDRGPVYSKLGKNVVYEREALRQWVREHRIQPNGLQKT